MDSTPSNASPNDTFVADCLRYLDGEMTEQEFASFQERIDRDPALQKQYVELSLLSEWIAEASGTEHAEEALAMADLITRTRVMQPAITDQPQKVETREVFSIARELALRAMRTKAFALGSAAAMILIGVIAYFALVGSGDNNTATPPITANPDTPSSIAAPIVATLTAEHDATWAEGALAPGSPLRAGQRLTLTQGLAEVTTKRGAIATLEAPCTVEMTDSGNGIRLVGGKMVGRCETLASKGFTVDTPTARITDLGTEFGVSVDGNDVTDTHVYSGEVVVEASANSGTSGTNLRTNLTRGYAARIDRVAGITTRQAQTAVYTRSLKPAGQQLAELSRVVLADEPIAFYRFDQMDSDHVTNLAGDKYHGQVFGKVETVQSPLPAWRMNADRGAEPTYMRVDDQIAEVVGDTWSVELWLRVREDRQGAVFNLRKKLGAGGAYGSVWYEKDLFDKTARQELAGLSGLRLSNFKTPTAQSPETFVEYTAPGAAQIDRWHHVVACTNAQGTRLYVDGQVVAQDDRTLLISEAPDALFVGCLRDDLSGPVNLFTGDIAGVAVYGKALDEQAVATRWAIARPLMQTSDSTE